MNPGLAIEATGDRVTPVAFVDEAAMEANLARMSRAARAAGVRLRPHGKTHKSAYVAQRQLAHGAIGLTAATLLEAEEFLTAGVNDLLLAHPPAGAVKLRRLEALAERAARLAVSVDDVDLAATLPASVEILWEVDTGHHRLGTQPGRESAEAVVELAGRIGAERVRGLLTHGGHAYRAEDEAARRRAAEEEASGLQVTAALLAERGLEMRELSVGTTPTADLLPPGFSITEMRPGTYVFGDANQVALGSMQLDQVALGVVATVVSTPARDRAVIDAGSKALSGDRLVPSLKGFGRILEHDHIRVDRLSEEHGVLVADGPTGLHIGDRVVVVPAHACTTVNLHPGLLFISASGVRWEASAMRGWS